MKVKKYSKRRMKMMYYDEALVLPNSCSVLREEEMPEFATYLI